jgi:hypothetical protein
MPSYNLKFSQPTFPNHENSTAKAIFSSSTAAEAIPKAIPTLLVSTRRKLFNQNPFRKGQVARRDNFPPLAVAQRLTS